MSSQQSPLDHIDNVFYSVPLSELFFKLFKSKRCPTCRCKLVHSRPYVVKTGEEVQLGNRVHHNEVVFASNAPVKVYYDLYTCQSCGSTYKLSDLMK